MDPRIFLVVIVVLAAAWIGYRIYEGIRKYMEFGGGKRLVTCPETKDVVAVETDAAHVGFTAAVGVADLRLRTCTRWPEKQDCGQECLAQVEIAPKESLVRTIVERWYEDKHCVFCGKEIGVINWTKHQPGLVDESRRTVQWFDVPAERLPDLLAKCWPVCWNCHISESFRRSFPNLVVDRNRDAVSEKATAEK